MRRDWNDILRFLFNTVLVLAIFGLLFLITLIFDFVRWIL